MDKCALPEGEISQVSNTVSKIQINYGKAVIVDTIDNEVEEDEDDEDDPDLFEEELLSQMGYATTEPECSCYYTEEVEGEKQDCSKRKPLNNVATPVSDLKLVSALKGSRDKPKKESRVSWAPDVYDPPPSAERFFQNGPDQTVKVIKVNAGKNKQKSSGKGGGGGRGKGAKGGKEKKQGKKNGGGHGSKYSNSGEF